MSDPTRRRSDLPEEAPNQYSTGDRCIECARPLSRYNPYVVCGPCRMRIAADVVDDYVEDDAPELQYGYLWERFAKRTPLRRGSLLEIEG
jgi:hypothetical protein